MITNGDITLNGGTQTVSGTLYHQGGAINMSMGKLNIGGSFSTGTSYSIL